MIWQLSVLACLGVFGGVLSGLVGVGGGIIFDPALIYVAGWNIEQAAEASFVVIFFAALSSIMRNTSGESPVDWRADRKSVGEGKSVDLGGRRVNKKRNRHA